MNANFRQTVLGDEFADLLGEPVAAAVVKADVEALCGELISNLESQLKLYVAYIVQANRQRMALVNRRLVENQDVNQEVDRLLNALGGLEENRIRITNSIIGPRLMGAASTPVKCEAIYPLVSAEKAKRLKECRNLLTASVGELKQTLATNQALVENGSRIVHTTIGIMTSVVGRSKAQKMNTYNAKGDVRVGKIQIRNLVNRSV